MAKSYSKDAMAEALLKLSRKKSIKKITINDIVEECDLSKRTFYNNFLDKDDLVQYVCTSEGKKNTNEALRRDLHYRDTIELYYSNSLEISYFYRSFIHEHDLQLLLYRCIAQSSAEHLRDSLKHVSNTDELPPDIELAIQFNAAGNADLFLWWILGNMKTSPAEMADANYACIPQSIKDYYHRFNDKEDI